MIKILNRYLNDLGWQTDVRTRGGIIIHIYNHPSTPSNTAYLGVWDDHARLRFGGTAWSDSMFFADHIYLKYDIYPDDKYHTLSIYDPQLFHEIHQIIATKRK